MVSGSLGLMVSGNNQHLGLTTGRQMAVCSLFGWLCKNVQWYWVLLDDAVWINVTLAGMYAWFLSATHVWHSAARHLLGVGSCLHDA